MQLLGQIRGLPLELLEQRNTQLIAEALPVNVLIGSVSREAFATWAAKTGLRAKIEDYSKTVDHPLRSISLALIDVLRSPTSGIDFGLVDNQYMLSVWVALGEITQEQADELLNIACNSTAIDEMQVRKTCWSDNGEWLV